LETILVKKKTEILRQESDIAERNGNLQKVAEIRYGAIPEAEKELKAAEKKLVAMQGGC
jgi:ATP-dependent Clp protease ATP-binding subunit ClpB